jgi:hypothetical protein
MDVKMAPGLVALLLSIHTESYDPEWNTREYQNPGDMVG